MTKCDTCKKRRRCINAYVAEPEIMNGCIDYVQRTNRDMPYSPWGPITGQKSLIRGIRSIWTSRGGGIMVTEVAAKKYLTNAAIIRGYCWGKYICYDQNAEAAIVLKELIEKGVFTTSEQFENKINEKINKSYPDYLKERRE